MNLSPRHTRLVAFVVGEELARRRRSGMPIPALLLELHRALSSNLDACDLGSASAVTESVTIENVSQRARRLGQSKSTVRRYAAQTGGRKVGRDWIWEIFDNHRSQP